MFRQVTGSIGIPAFNEKSREICSRPAYDEKSRVICGRPTYDVYIKEVGAGDDHNANSLNESGKQRKSKGNQSISNVQLMRPRRPK